MQSISSDNSSSRNGIGKSRLLCENGFLALSSDGVPARRLRMSGVTVSTSVVLICAVLASLAVGVLVAYGICLAMFQMFRVHARQIHSQTQAVLPTRAA